MTLFQILKNLFAPKQQPARCALWVENSSPSSAASLLPTERAEWPNLRLDALRSEVVRLALDLNRVAADEDGDLMECQQATVALFAACDRLAKEHAAEQSQTWRNELSADLERELTEAAFDPPTAPRASTRTA